MDHLIYSLVVSIGDYMFTINHLLGADACEKTAAALFTTFGDGTGLCAAIDGSDQFTVEPGTRG